MPFIRPKQEREDATFDLTAMIDVVLLLIIFFMLTSQFAATDRAVIELPAQKGLEAAAAAKGAELVIDIDQHGATRMLGREASLDGILNEAAAAARAAPEGGVRVLLRAHKDCPASAVRALCAALVNAGIRTVSLGTSGEGARN
jgi:biopolymer transport protein ExbD